ncbi:MAG: right-handed parallel beta-helix repeat-containing protein, partial [Methanobacteriota archaeon]
MRRRRPGARVRAWSALALVATMAVAPPVSAEEGGLVIGEDTTIQDRTVSLRGDLVVQAGATLVLERATVVFENAKRGEHGVRIEPGASFLASSSTFRSTGERFTFEARGDRFELRDSTVAGAGWIDGDAIRLATGKAGEIERSGIFFAVPGALLVRNRISGGGVGLFLAGPDAVAEENEIRGNDAVGIVVRGDRARIENNTVLQPYAGRVGAVGTLGVFAFGVRDLTIAGNRVEDDPYPSPNFDANAVTVAMVENATLTRNSVRAWRPYTVFQSKDVTLSENEARGGEHAVNAWFGERLTIVGNSFVMGPPGIPPTFVVRLVRQVGAEVRGNELVATATPGLATVSVESSSDVDFSENVVEAPNDVGEGDGKRGCACVTVLHTRGSTFRGNVFRHQAHGLVLVGSEENEIRGNEVDASRGPVAIRSPRNRFSGNAFVGLATDPFDDAGSTWSGNYWSRGTALDPAPLAAAPPPDA